MTWMQRLTVAGWFMLSAPGLAWGQIDHSAHDHGAPTAVQADPVAARDTVAHEPLMDGHDMHRSRRNYLFVRMDRLEQQGSAERQALDLQLSYGDGYRKSQLDIDLTADHGQAPTGALEARYAWAVHPFWDWQAGVQRAIGTDNERTWLRFGFEGLAPYWFHLQGGVGLADDGQSQFDIVAEYDLLFTQRLILQARMAAQARGKADPREGLPGGWQSLSAGWRLRYEFSRQLAPYIGVERSHQRGAAGGQQSFWVLGMRAWF